MKRFITEKLPSLDANEFFEGTLDEIIEKLTRIRDGWKERCGYKNIACKLDSGYSNADLELYVTRWETDLEEFARCEYEQRNIEEKIESDLDLYFKLKKQFDKQ